MPKPVPIHSQIFGALMRRILSDSDTKICEVAKALDCSRPLISQTVSGVNPPNIRIEDFVVSLAPADERNIRRLATVARLSTGQHAQDFQNFVAWSGEDRRAA